ncbi:hypothetical protein FXV77_10585 [Sphingobacterium phlebotomi]|uniref:Uncharacterized protein n=1 Tax=Sphingobacterium phlebotomi TaxID=2605433 RepID=A0A5D4H6F3_9SPHI|nr:hypothetical protein [Sphingobacterium phlebotomi]TYR36346.1 hypothetical protein FXV77_10585 [Sphingobacterium phlebotomi]
MKKLISKISQAVQVILLAPIKLPVKALNVLKYIAVGLGIMETVLDREEENSPQTEGKEGGNADDD